MTREEALTIVCEAAGKWADEIVMYIIPDGTYAAGEVEALQQQADQIGEALGKLSTGGPL